MNATFVGPAPVKALTIELTDFPEQSPDCSGYQRARLLIRQSGAPVGYIDADVTEGALSLDAVKNEINTTFGKRIIRRLIRERLKTPIASRGLTVADLFERPIPETPSKTPLVTVAVCTRDRAADLDRCLTSLIALDYPALDLIVVDNAPATDATRRLCEDRFPAVRYVLEPRPGLDWARNRAILEARGEIIAFADDDVVVDRHWASVLVETFEDSPEVAAVTGFVAPFELESAAQLRYEQRGSLCDLAWLGYEPSWRRRTGRQYHTGNLGAGANMAFRRELFGAIGLFDPALDVGTVTNGGGDLEMFFRVIHEGYVLVWQPAALVWHRHRDNVASLNRQITNNGVGFMSHLVRSALAYPDQAASFARAVGTFLTWEAKQLIRSIVAPHKNPRDFVARELWGALSGIPRYHRARATAKKIAAEQGDQPRLPRLPSKLVRSSVTSTAPRAVRAIDLTKPLAPLTDVIGYEKTRIFVCLGDTPIGSFDVRHTGGRISVAQLRDVSAGWMVERLGRQLGPERIREIVESLISGQPPKPSLGALPIMRGSAPKPLTATTPVSIVLATLDRPADLQACLTALGAQQTRRNVEIVVVDNNPSSGKTRPTTDLFPGVVLVEERRRGLAYARNAGFLASAGAIAVAIDDDVIAPPEWLEKLLAPFADAEVMAVTGNVLPRELETRAQFHFERYGGLGKGFERRVFDAAWFHSFRGAPVAVAEIGATANAAFRTSIFSDPDVGLMDETLGPGMPSGVGEDAYLFYRILKAGSKIVYEPGAFVWHRHRRDDKGLRKQIWNYSKGEVAYQLTTLLRDHDLRAAPHLLFSLPCSQAYWLARQTGRSLRGSDDVPARLVLTCIAGNLAGPYALWKSRRRVAREGKSTDRPSIKGVEPGG